MPQPDEPEVVQFAGQQMRPDLAAEAVELALMVEALKRGGRHHAEHGGKADCGCPLRIDGTEPYLHREGCHRHGEPQGGAEARVNHYVSHVGAEGPARTTLCGEPWQGWQCPPEHEWEHRLNPAPVPPHEQPRPHRDGIRPCGACFQVYRER